MSIKLTPKQESGIKILKSKIKNKDKVSVLQGVAGSGKSTSLKFLLESLNYSPTEVVFTAFTGAATRLLQKKGLHAATIHSLIYTPIINRGVCIGFRKIPKSGLNHLRLIVVDEFSMVNKELMEDLLSFKIPLLLVGDPAQLPPIGNSNCFMNQADVFLDEVMRQALDNPILWAATKIRQNEILKDGVYGDILFVGRKKDLQESWLRKEVQFICGMNNTRNELNLSIKGNPEVAVGDKVIFLKNDWENGVINGSMANLTKVQKKFRGYNLNFTDDMGLHLQNYFAYFQVAPIKKDQYFDWAYAVTCHKSQGSTYDCAGVVIDESYVFGEYRTNWLYTAITRFTGNHNVALLR